MTAIAHLTTEGDAHACGLAHGRRYIETGAKGPRTFVAPADVLFVSSNPFDACGAKAFGLKVAWIGRVTPAAMAEACQKNDLIAPLTMFRALRMQMDELGLEPDYRVNGLSALVEILSSIPS